MIHAIDSVAKFLLPWELTPSGIKPQPSTTDFTMINTIIASSLTAVAAVFSA